MQNKADKKQRKASTAQIEHGLSADKIKPFICKCLAQKQAVQPTNHKESDKLNERTYDTRLQSIKEALKSWVKAEYKPKYFITIRLPINQESRRLDYSFKHLKKIMITFERLLLKRHWNKKHLRFVSIAEQGTSDTYHFHLLLNSKDYTIDVLENVWENVKKTLSLSDYCIDIKPIDECTDETVLSYCAKEIEVYYYNKMNSDKIMFSEDLLNLPYKNTYPRES